MLIPVLYLLLLHPLAVPLSGSSNCLSANVGASWTRLSMSITPFRKNFKCVRWVGRRNAPPGFCLQLILFREGSPAAVCGPSPLSSRCTGAVGLLIHPYLFPAVPVLQLLPVDLP